MQSSKSKFIPERWLVLTSEDSLRILLPAIEQASDLVVITDKNGTIEYVNLAFERLTGYSRAEVVGQTPRILNLESRVKSFTGTCGGPSGRESRSGRSS